MTNEEYKWYVNLVQDRYEWLKLSFEQAEAVYRFEEEESNSPTKHPFTFFEECDYQLAFFQQILNPEQYKVFQKDIEERIERYVKTLIESDREQLVQLEYLKELLEFYKNKFVPSLLVDKQLTQHFKFIIDDSKHNFLKTEYRKYLNDRKREIILLHIRAYRNYKPITLQTSLLRHEIETVVPSFYIFKMNMDEPAKSAFQFIKAQLEPHQISLDEQLKRKLKELEEESDLIYKRHISEEPTGGWHVTIEKSEETNREERIFTFVLLI